MKFKFLKIILSILIVLSFNSSSSAEGNNHLKKENFKEKINKSIKDISSFEKLSLEKQNEVIDNEKNVSSKHKEKLKNLTSKERKILLGEVKDLSNNIKENIENSKNYKNDKTFLKGQKSKIQNREILKSNNEINEKFLKSGINIKKIKEVIELNHQNKEIALKFYFNNLKLNDTGNNNLSKKFLEENNLKTFFEVLDTFDNNDLENKNLDPTKTSILYYSLDDRINELEKLFNNQNKSNNRFYFLHNTNSGINLKRLKNINSQLSYIEKVAQVMGLSK